MNSAGLKIHEKLLIILVGISLIVAGVFCIRSDKAKMARCTKSVTAEVVSERKSGGSLKNYTPVFAINEDGVNYQVEAKNGSRIGKRFKNGEKYQVCYDPDEPEILYIESESNNIRNIGCVGVGALLTACGIFLAIPSRNKK